MGITNVEFEYFTSEELHDYMKGCIKNAEVLQLPPTVTRVVLNKLKWDIDKYFEIGEDQVCACAMIDKPLSEVEKSTNDDSTDDADRLKECKICCLQVSPSEMMGLNCNHIFCISCWIKYMTEKIRETFSDVILCPDYECKCLVEDETVMSLIEDVSVKSMYKKSIINNFVQNNKQLHWCTNENCGYTIKVEQPGISSVRCICGNKFCSGCGETPHGLVSCIRMNKWDMNFKNDMASMEWIKRNCIACPNCRSAIEKIGGCSTTILCRCKQVLTLKNSGNNFVNEYYFFDAESQVKIRNDDDSIFDLYMNHKEKLSLKQELKDNVLQMFQRLQCKDYFFPKKIVDILCECRETLMHTYVFAYNLKENNHSIIFKESQRYLDLATERLSDYLDQILKFEDPECVNLESIECGLKGAMDFCIKRRKALLNICEEGYDKNLWTFKNL